MSQGSIESASGLASPVVRAVRAATAAAFVLGIVAGASPARAAALTYYVAPYGSDSNPGTEALPFRTIQRAANVVNPGDTVTVEDGTYTGDGVGTSCASSTSRPVVCLARGGTSTAWVTFRARNPLGAKIDGRSNTSTHGFRFLATANYIRIEGFEVFGLGSATNGASGFVIYSGGHDVVIAGNDIHDIGRLCTDHVYGMNGIFIQNARVRVERNRIHDIGRFAPGEQGCSPSSTNYQNHDHGVYVNGTSDGYAPGASDVQVVNNVFSNIQRGWAMQIYPDPVMNLQVLNNTFAAGNPYRTGHILVAASTTNAQVIDNVFDEPTTAALNFNAGTHTNFTLANNLSSRGLANSIPAGVVRTNNLENVDPQLSTYDYSPFSTSPAIDRGMTMAEVGVDINGAARPNGVGPDLGAYEFGGAAAPPPPPPPPPPTDTVAPVVTIAAPLEGATVSRSVSIQATATDNVGVVSVRFQIDGQTIATDTSAPYSASWNARKAARGAHRVTAIATDAAGVQAVATVTIYR